MHRAEHHDRADACAVYAQLLLMLFVVVVTIVFFSSSSSPLDHGALTPIAAWQAWFCARAFNRLLAGRGWPPLFDYLISGGDRALVLSVEAPEDQPWLGERDLRAACDGLDAMMLVGITCGLSAPYVAGQVAYALQMTERPCASVVIGFNPVELARNTAIEGWVRAALMRAPAVCADPTPRSDHARGRRGAQDKTCRDVFVAAQQRADETASSGCWAGSAHVLNPVVGPEPITGPQLMRRLRVQSVPLIDRCPAPDRRRGTGSSRMKGGSMTLMLLHAVFGSAIERALDPRLADTTEQDVARVLHGFEATYRATYAAALQTQLADVVECCASSYLRAGHLYYIGADPWGWLGCLDASEMVDTYGAAADETRAFVHGGWSTADGRTPVAELQRDRLLHLDLADFCADLLPALSARDTARSWRPSAPNRFVPRR